MKVLVIVYVKDTGDIVPGCLEAIHAQDYRDFTLLVHEMKAIPLNDSPQKNKSENITRNRNYVRPMALASGAEWIMWIDSDVIIPPNAISDFMKCADEKGSKLMGGWYKKINSPDWVACRWIKPGVVRYFKEPVKGVIEADLVGIGCSMMHRSVLQKLEFRTAVEEYNKDEAGNTYYTGNCFSFCEDAKALGVRPYLVGSIVCEHVVPR